MGWVHVLCYIMLYSLIDMYNVTIINESIKSIIYLYKSVIANAYEPMYWCQPGEGNDAIIRKIYIILIWHQCSNDGYLSSHTE